MAGSESGRRRRDSEPGAKRQAGRYVLGDLLGRGGMAEVFAGHSLGDHGFQKPVAIKRLLPELANDKVFVDRLIQEAKLLVGMTHGNVVSVIDLARDGEDVFLVMDFVDGPSLRQLLKARGTKPLPLGISSYIVQSAAAGLEFAHARPGGAIVHADISPSNLLLTTSGEVRVADFGIARREGGGWGVVEGKWAYMAPEQARGEPLTPRSDVFALGVVLYELITGAHPFGRQVTAEERESSQMRVVPPRVVKPSVPPGLDAICMRALAHDPRDRYARMQHMIDAIMDERFTNQWREGANDLAKLITESAPSVSPSGGHAAPGGPRTMVTERPVTLFTRSLIDQTPAPRRSAPRAPSPRSESQIDRPSQSNYSHYDRSSQSQFDRSHIADRASQSSIADSVAETRESFSQASASQSIIVEAQAAPPPEQPNPMAKLLEMPNLYNPNGPAMPAWQLNANPSVREQELGSVHGGTASAHAGASMAAAGDARSNKWTITVLALAAAFGVVAAIVLQMRPSSSEAADVPATTTKPQQVAQVAPPPKADLGEATDLSAATPPPPVQTPPVQPPPVEPTPPPTVAEPVVQPTQESSLPKLTDPLTTAPVEDKPVDDKPQVAETPPPPKDNKKPTRANARVATPPARTPRPPVEKTEKVVAKADKPSKESGFLRVSAYPWGWVSIDNGPRKPAPLRVTLPAGRHSVRIFTDDDSRVRTVSIEKDQVKVLSLDWEVDQIQEN